MTTRISRRSFLKSSSALAAGATLPAWFLEETMARAADAAAGKPLSPNDKPGVALIGCGGRGRGVAGEAAKLGQMLAVCDVDDANLAEARKTLPDA